MRAGYYRLTVVGCALSWLLLGLHLPALHQMTHHGRAPGWGVVAAVLLLAAAGAAGLWALLRTPPGPARSPGPDGA